MRLFIQPFDVLFFRESKPFPMGEAHLARSTFPPSPGVFQGAIRSRIISDNGGFDTYSKQIKNNKTGELIEAIGGPGENGKHDYGRLKIKGPVIAKKVNSELKEYFPIPLDFSFSPVKNRLSRIQFDYNEFIPLVKNRKQTEETEKNNQVDFIEKNDLIKYLKRELVKISDLKNETFFKYEDRVGIKISDANTTQEGMFYTAEYIRLNEDTGFCVYVSGVDNLIKADTDILALGGKRRTAFFTKDNEDIIIKKEDIKDAISGCPGFKLYLATPGMFRNGWYPDIDKSKFDLITADLGKSLYIGGFDVYRKRPKTLRRAVPAGSVFYYKPKNGEIMNEKIIDEVLDRFHEKCISEFDSNIGFGLCFVGGWNYV